MKHLISVLALFTLFGCDRQIPPKAKCGSDAECCEKGQNSPYCEPAFFRLGFKNPPNVCTEVLRQIGYNVVILQTVSNPDHENWDKKWTIALKAEQADLTEDAYKHCPDLAAHIGL